MPTFGRCCHPARARRCSPRAAWFNAIGWSPSPVPRISCRRRGCFVTVDEKTAERYDNGFLVFIGNFSSRQIVFTVRRGDDEEARYINRRIISICG